MRRRLRGARWVKMCWRAWWRQQFDKRSIICCLEQWTKNARKFELTSAMVKMPTTDRIRIKFRKHSSVERHAPYIKHEAPGTQMAFGTAEEHTSHKPKASLSNKIAQVTAPSFASFPYLDRMALVIGPSFAYFPYLDFSPCKFNLLHSLGLILR